MARAADTNNNMAVKATSQEGNAGISSKWLIFGLCATAFFLAYFHRVSSAVIASDLRSEFGVSASALGLLSSMYFYAYAGLQIPIGVTADRVSPRLIIVAGLAIAALGSVIFGLSRNFTVSLFGRVLTGAGVSTIYIPSLKLLAQSFGSRRFATVTGLLVAVGNFGALSASTPFAVLVAGIGWRYSFFTIAAITLLVGFLCWEYLPREKGRTKAGSRISATEESFGGRVPENGNGSLARTHASLGIMWLLGAVMFLRYGPLMGYQGLWGIPYLSDVFSMGKVHASNIVMAVPIGYMLGGPLIGRLNDRGTMDPKSLMFASNLVFALTWIPLAFLTGSSPTWLLYFCGMLMGMMSGGAGVIGYSLARSLADSGTEATGMGIVNACSLAGGAVFQPLMGSIIDKASNMGVSTVGAYSFAFKFAFMCAVGMLALTLIVKRPCLDESAGNRPGKGQ